MPTDPTLLSSLAARLDKHLLLPVLRFAKERAGDAGLATQYSQAIDAVTTQTSMPSAALTSEKQEELEKNFTKVLKNVGPLQELYFTNTEETGMRLKFVGRDFSDAVRSGKFSSSEIKTAGAKPRNVRALYDVAFMLVDAGNYDQAADILKVFNVLMRDTTDTAEDGGARSLSALWGQFMCDVLLGYGDSSRVGLEKLLQQLDERAADEANNARCELLHWALFHWFKRGETSAMLDLIFSFDRMDRTKTFLYANVIQCMAPHLLRYVAVAAVLSKKKKSTLFRAARLLDSDSYQYSDVFTQFLVQLCINANFGKATELLNQCSAELKNDFFCADLHDDFISNARQMLFEDQLRVRKTLSIQSAADNLSMTKDAAELWLVDLIREAKLDATVDSVAGTVRVNSISGQKSVWQHVLDRLESTASAKPVPA